MPPIISAGQLRGPRLLCRSDGHSWSDILQPILRDTATLPHDAPLGLDEFDWLIQILLADFRRYPLPEQMIVLGPQELGQLDPVAFASFVVGHRAERLVQCAELSAGALDNLEHGSLQLAAVAARALFEIAAVTGDVQAMLDSTWPEVHGSADAVRDVASRADGNLYQALWTARMGTRLHAPEDGWPPAINVKTRFDRFGRGGNDFSEMLNEVYDWLCEATHPNVESQGVLWRVGSRDSEGRQLVRFDPSASQSPIKTMIIDALRIAFKVIVPYCRDLWWIAAEIACVCGFPNSMEMFALGLPRPTRQQELCCCGSGIMTERCDHPVPPLPSAEWEAFQTSQ